MGKTWEEVAATPCEFSVKNTFIDVQQNCQEIDWQRQVSEPALMWQRQFSECQIPSECQIAWAHPAQSSTQETLEEPEGEPLRRLCTPEEQEMSSTTDQDGSTGGSCTSARRIVTWAAAVPAVGGDQDEQRSAQQPPPPPPGEWESMHTVMMRNLPNKYTQQMLMFEINQAGFHGRFDFLYLPIDPETGANRGYAFLNFDDSAWAWLFRNVFEGCKMNHFNSGKVVSVHAAALQGFEANHAHYSSSRVNRGDPAMRPIFFREPSGDKSIAASGRKGRRRRSGGASAIDVAARKQQQQLEQQEQQEEKQQTPTLESLPEPEALAMTEEAEATPMPPASAVKPAPLGLPLTLIAPPSPSISTLAAPVHANTPLEVCKATFCEYCDGKVEAHHQFCHFCGSTLVSCMASPPPSEVHPGFGPAEVSACGDGGVQAFPLCYILVPRPAVEPSWTAA